MTPKKTTPNPQMPLWQADENPRPAVKAPAALRVRARKRRKDGYRNDLSDEIAMLREVLFNVADLTSQERSPDEMLKLLDKISQACTRLGTLLKTNLQLTPADDLTQAFNQAIEIVNDPEKLRAYLNERNERKTIPGSSPE